jgi:hypothetical protein
MGQFWKILSAFLLSGLFFAKMGMPAAILAYKFHFLKVFAITVSGGLTGTVIFTFLSASLINWWKHFKAKYFTTHKKAKVFTKSNRRIIRIKRRFGLAGIAFFTPILLSVPLGAFLGERFYRKKQKVIFALSLSIILWEVVLYFIYYFFYSSLHKFL